VSAFNIQGMLVWKSKENVGGHIYNMTTQMTYDRPLAELWEQAITHITSGEHGWLTIPLTNKVETKGEYYLIAENSPKYENTIYASIYVEDPNLTSIPFGFEQEIEGKRFITIPVTDVHIADACFKVWEDSQQNGIGITSATHYIIRKIAK
jgi:hypothetical protein